MFVDEVSPLVDVCRRTAPVYPLVVVPVPQSSPPSRVRQLQLQPGGVTGPAPLQGGDGGGTHQRGRAISFLQSDTFPSLPGTTELQTGDKDSLIQRATSRLTLAASSGNCLPARRSSARGSVLLRNTMWSLSAL